uniref:Uncharacterized protein n=1 Tax=Cacopsylla melanoneura TaxID=428564 RepID=A0A8D9E261_9HEMI
MKPRHHLRSLYLSWSSFSTQFPISHFSMNILDCISVSMSWSPFWPSTIHFHFIHLPRYSFSVHSFHVTVYHLNVLSVICCSILVMSNVLLISTFRILSHLVFPRISQGTSFQLTVFYWFLSSSWSRSHNHMKV